MTAPQTAAPQLTASPAIRWALACLSLSMLLSSLGTSIANVALPTLAQAFAASFQQVQWIVIAYLLAITCLTVAVGRLGDRTGRRRLLLAGIGLFTAASVVCGLAPALWLLIAARAAQGIGAAVMMALTMAFVGDTVPKARTGAAMGLLGTMSAIGTALGPSLGGLLISGLGWRAIFFANVPLGVLAIFLASRHLPVDQRSTGPAAPMIRLASLRDPALGAGLAMSALVSTVMMATLVVGPFYLARSIGLGAAGVGLVMSVGPVVTALTSVPAGRVADRFGVRRMTLLGLVAMTVGSLALSALPTGLGIPGYVAPIVVLTIGYAVFQTSNNTAVMADVRPDQRGVISGTLTLSRNLGLITGASVMGAVFTFASASTDVATADPAEVATGMHGTFAVATTLIAIAIGGWTLARRAADR